MVKVQDFSAANFEQNLGHVEGRVATYKEALRQAQGEIPSEISEREVVKEALKFESQIVLGAQTSSGNDDGVPSQSANTSFLPDYFEGGDEDGMREAVIRLADTALRGNLKHALSEARKLSPYLEDAFHDALVDKILPEMKKRGLI